MNTSVSAMDTMWLQAAETCARHIIEHGYYLSRWEKVKHKKPIRDCSKQEALKPFQDFWEILPDSPAIRTEPFFEICGLAEEYCFGENS